MLNFSCMQILFTRKCVPIYVLVGKVGERFSNLPQVVWLITEWYLNYYLSSGLSDYKHVSIILIVPSPQTFEVCVGRSENWVTASSVSLSQLYGQLTKGAFKINKITLITFRKYIKVQALFSYVENPPSSMVPSVWTFYIFAE